MSVRRRQLLGTLVLVVALLVAVALWKRPDPFATNVTVRAELRDANGLAPIGADVRVAGVPVGRITRIQRAGSLALLTMSVARSAGTVHRDATLALRPRLLFEGTAYAELSLGSPSAPPLGRSLIPPSRTSTYVPLADALSVLRASQRANVHTLAGAVTEVLSARSPAQLRDTIAAAPALTGDAAVVAGAARGLHQTELRAAVDTLAHVSSAVAEQSPALGSSLGSAAQTSTALETVAGAPLSQTIAALPVTATVLRSGATAASAIVARLDRLAPQLEPGVAQLAPTLRALRPLLRRTAPVMSELDPVLADAQRAVEGATRGAAPATGAIQALEPTLQIFQSTLLGSLEQKTDLGDPAYLAFLGLFAGGGAASRPFGVGGQGHFMRFGLRFLTGVGLPLPPCTLLDKASPPLAVVLERLGGCTP